MHHDDQVFGSCSGVTFSQDLRALVQGKLEVGFEIMILFSQYHDTFIHVASGVEI